MVTPPPERVLALLAQTLEITRRMRAAADGEDWEHLTALEGERSAAEQTLHELAASGPLGEEPRCAALIRAIIAEDEAIRARVAEGMQSARQHLGEASRERALRNAYESAP